MSATPIPRTLEMAVTGIREMSTIPTPPEERHPVLTFVGAVRREADRRRHPPRAAARGPGLLHPQPGASRSTAPRPRLRELVPEARIATAHGQMNEHALEQVVRRLLGEAVRRPGLHDDRRVRPRHLQRQHPDRRARRLLGPVPAAPAARPGRPRPRARATPTSSTRRRSR